MERPVIGASACLLGYPVRFDGGHKKQRWLVNHLGSCVTLVPICPEMLMGLSSPRPSLRLVQNENHPLQLVETATGIDLSEQAHSSYLRVLDQDSIRTVKWDGFILKKNSPSCGVEKVRVHTNRGIHRNGQGLFARALQERYPLLPVIDEGRLLDLEQRESFLNRIYAFYRIRRLVPKVSALLDFHKRYKFILLEHSPEHAFQLNRLMASFATHKRQDLRVWIEKYMRIFLEALRVPSNLVKRTCVLQHAIGYFKDHLDTHERRHLLEVIRHYESGLLPYQVPLSWVSFFVQKLSISHLKDQYFFNPYPESLGLRKAL